MLNCILKCSKNKWIIASYCVELPNSSDGDRRECKFYFSYRLDGELIWNKNRLQQFELWETFTAISDLVLTGPKGYLDFQKLITNYKFIITDSGGIQEEATFY